ncbi:hypothetical protein A8950_3101 [Dongia mobilis]|uniref:Methyltransferase family protein n=1 Tax=Dongia mobilis TaxID=578943 RepID=A0A4R6WPX9_9PROT|nr:hypothetical protein [Dongia mobilis]TDQ80567.1 hypothetical protein A8950_3101 [Dongia mobilis]
MDNVATTSGRTESVRVKNEQAVFNHYNAGWSRYLAVAEAAYAEEGQNLARILSRCLAERGNAPRKQRGKYRPTVGGEPLSDRVNQAAHLAYYAAVMLEEIRARVPASTQRIIEMGSGWGAVITGLWLGGAPRDAEYWALEYTDAGQEVTKLFARAEPRFRLQTRHFDYHKADFSYLTEKLETVVYSTYSIEQITFIKDELIDRIMAIPGFTRCVHIEPVGWQVEPDAIIMKLDRLAKKLGLKALNQATASARRCWRHGKNRNLLETLRRYEKAGKIVIEKIDRDLVANDPLNPGTLVVWRRA